MLAHAREHGGGAGLDELARAASGGSGPGSPAASAPSNRLAPLLAEQAIEAAGLTPEHWNDRDTLCKYSYKTINCLTAVEVWIYRSTASAQPWNSHGKAGRILTKIDRLLL